MHITRYTSCLILIVLLALAVPSWGFWDFLGFGEKKYYEEAWEKDTVKGYENFLTEYPGGKFADRIKSRLILLNRTKRRIRIEVEQSYGKAEDFSLPFERDVSKLSGYAELNGVIIKIKVQGKPLGANYGSKTTFGSGGFFYTGARLAGNISLATPNGTVLKEKPFEAEVLPTMGVSVWNASASPKKAPFPTLYKVYLLPLFTEMLAQLYGTNSVIGALDDSEWHLHFAAAKALAILKDARATDYLIAMLASRCTRKRAYPDDMKHYAKRETLKALEKTGKLALDRLNIALNNEHECMQKAAAEALRHIRLANAVESFIRSLNDKEWDVQYQGLGALEKLRKLPVESLIAALNAQDVSVRRLAATAMGEIQDTRAFEALLRAYDDKDPLVRSNVIKALENIYDEAPLRWQKWLERNKGRFP